jgi:hypothetical protein
MRNGSARKAAPWQTEAEPPRESLRERVERLTVTPGRGGPLLATELVVVAVQSELGQAFETVRRELAGGRTVRFVAHGATLSCVWPSWVQGTNRLRLTELGAYQLPENTMIRSTRQMRDALRRWLREKVADAAPGAADEVFFPGAAVRLLNESFEVRPMVDGLVELHRKQRVVFVPETTVAGRLFAAMTQRDAVDARRRALLDRARWSAEVLAYVAAGLGLGLFSQLREIMDIRRSPEHLREPAGAKARPAASWVALIPDLVRVNRHVIELFALPALAEKELTGVLLVGSTRRGERIETDYRTRTGDALWPGLGELREGLDRLCVGQVIGPASFGEWASTFRDDVSATLGVVGRILRGGPHIGEGDIAHALEGVADEVGKLATLDVLRARSAARAACRLPLEAMAGARVAFVGCQTPAMAAVNAVLKKAGATTIDSLHGVAWGEVPATGESAASTVVTWTDPDAAAFRELGNRSVQAGMPVRLRPRRREPKASNILVLTSYVHRDHAALGFPLLAFQEDLLSLPDLIDRTATKLVFRWRPHPSDSPAHVEGTAAPRRDRLEVSPRGRSLQEDIDWSDIVVSSLSSAACEALLAEVPVFVHVPPHCDAWAEPFHPSRRFFRVAELVSPLLRLVGHLRGGAPRVLEPELHARMNFFGEAMVPRQAKSSLFTTR